MFIDDTNWEYVIGLEVHAQVSSITKLFSRSSTNFGAEPNSQVSLIDAAIPGTLPVLNRFCVEQAVKTGLGLNATINKISIFDRKNYFYPDLPQGYQISQFYHPIVNNGYLEINDDLQNKKRININRLHLEQDAGKSIHDASDYTYIDLNRAGIALMEIVTNPDIRSPFEAGEFLKKLRSVLRYLGTCDGNMEQGSLRCDANVSVRRVGDDYGTRCEIKNLNSIKNVMKAIEYEARRQVEILESGKVVEQETRLFNPDLGVTKTMRSKEEAHDYRYFPDPDLLPLQLSDSYIESIKATLPELPDQKVLRYQQDFDLKEIESLIITADKEVANYFEKAIHLGGEPKLVANWLTSELFGLLNKNGVEFKDNKISPSHLVDLVNLITNNTISGKIAKTVFVDSFITGKMPSEIVKEKNLEQISDPAEIKRIIIEVLKDNPESVSDYKNGKERLFGFFVGQVLKNSGGKANPDMVNNLLKNMLETK